MPLLKRKPVPPVATPTLDSTKKDKEVWYSPYTHEIFLDYSEYLKRTLLYKKPIWQCEATGKVNLTYLEALKSEKEENNRTGNKLSLELQKQVLLHVQFQALENEYKVQLLDEESLGIEDMIKTLPKDKIKRERFAFSKNLLKKFLKEHTIRDGYVGSPWNIKPETAERFQIDTTLPEQLYEARNVALAKSRKKRPLDEPETDSNKEQVVRYPIEDLNLPVYRRDPSGFGKITDMTPGSKDALSKAQNPTGGMSICPSSTETSVPQESYGAFLMIWSFLSVFAHPLKLSPFSLDDFENALHYKEPSILMRECNVALLNAIIKQRERFKKECQGNGTTAVAAAMSLYGTGYGASRSPSSIAYQETLRRLANENQMDISRLHPATALRETNPDRGCGSPEIETIGHEWDHGTVDTEEEREGWEDILIGFLNQLAPIDMLEDIDRILASLVLFAECTLEDREDCYAGLSLSDKVKIFELLISVANESYVIKSYMDDCQEQMTELRKQKIELSRERKRIQTERRELEDKLSEDKQTEDEQKTEENDDTKETSEDLIESDNESAASDNEDSAFRHESRQEAMKRRQAEREERETKRMKLHHLQREEARVKNQEQKQRSELRKRLDDDERALHKKEEQVERELRKYSTHRIKPLGRDKFFNRYYYLDDIGGTLLHGSGRFFVQCPSDTDLIVIQERDFVESLDMKVQPPCGRGGGVQFVSQLLKVQGFDNEYMEKRLKMLNGEQESVEAWWRVFDKPEQREIEKYYQQLVTGMKKRATDQANTTKNEVSRRATRNKSTPTFPTGSWLAYTNKFA
ncbi:hypothetical protein G6F56_001521 [Rhizopus delemar]|nr:hypothetical protein G6F56_001521 [Rhizopus delemar]